MTVSPASALLQFGYTRCSSGYLSPNGNCGRFLSSLTVNGGYTANWPAVTVSDSHMPGQIPLRRLVRPQSAASTDHPKLILLQKTQSLTVDIGLIGLAVMGQVSTLSMFIRLAVPSWQPIGCTGCY